MIAQAENYMSRGIIIHTSKGHALSYAIYIILIFIKYMYCCTFKIFAWVGI